MYFQLGQDPNTIVMVRRDLLEGLQERVLRADSYASQQAIRANHAEERAERYADAVRSQGATIRRQGDQMDAQRETISGLAATIDEQRAKLDLADLQRREKLANDQAFALLANLADPDLTVEELRKRAGTIAYMTVRKPDEAR